MATRYHIGAKSLRGDISSYAKRFDLLEVAVRSAEELRLMPSATTLRRWRKQVPPHFEFAVIAGPAMSALTENEAFDRELASFTETQDLLEARIVVVKTPVDITPAARSREKLRAFVTRVKRDATTVVWEPSGLWELEDAAAFAKKIDVVIAVDPSRDEVPEGQIAYGRLRAIGETKSFGSAALERVALKIGDRRDAYVVIETESALAECKNLRKAAVRTRGGKQGGMGRLIRPRNAVKLVAPDDEQE